MDYTIQQLARLAGVTARTLRWYDEIGLLKPSRRTESGQRCYGPAQVNRLQDILFYRALGVELAQIRAQLDAPDFCRLAALQGHLTALEAEQQRIRVLIRAVEETITAIESEAAMNDEAKFKAWKQGTVQQYEQCREQEARALYGSGPVEDFKQALWDLSEIQYRQGEELGRALQCRLEQAVCAKAATDGPEGREITALHRQWLLTRMKQCSAAMHRGLAQLYTTDERFTRYYDGHVPGCAAFLRDAILHWAT